jgi:hypothetical protein
MLQDLYAPTINAQPATAAPTAAATLQPTCAVAAGTITVTAPTGTGSRIALMVRLYQHYWNIY